MAIQQYLPSKEFKKKVTRLLALLLLAAIIRFGAYPLIQNLFNRNKLPANVTVKEFVDIDTDGDKLPDWEESIWGTNPKKADSDGDGVSDFEYVASKKQGLSQVDQNETTILSSEIMQTLFALTAKGAATDEAIANLGDAAGQTIIKPVLVDKYAASSFTVVGTSTAEVKNYYTSFQKAYNTFSKSNAPDEFEILSIAISSESPDQLVDLDLVITKYSMFERNLTALKVPSDVLQIHVALVNSVSSIISSLEKSKGLYDNSIVGLNGIVELRLAHTKLDEQAKLLGSYFSRAGLIKPI